MDKILLHHWKYFLDAASRAFHGSIYLLKRIYHERVAKNFRKHICHPPKLRGHISKIFTSGFKICTVLSEVVMKYNEFVLIKKIRYVHNVYTVRSITCKHQYFAKPYRHFNLCSGFLKTGKSWWWLNPGVILYKPL